MCLLQRSRCYNVKYSNVKNTSSSVLLGFRPDKTHAASFLNDFKNIPGKACVKRVHNNDDFVNAGNQHTRKTLNTAY